MKKLISIIIPVYNSINYMERCLKCLDEQTSNQFEVIFIDDCSTDNSYEELCEKLKEVKYSYQLLKNEKNMGPGLTRNRGIDNANGEYLLFVDSDDFISNDCIEKLVFLIENDEFDCVIFDYHKLFENGKLKKFNTMHSNIDKIDNKILLALSSGSTCCKLYKKKTIKDNNVYFPDLIRSEDLVFNKIAISKCKNVFYLKEPLYYYYQRSNSIMHDVSTLNPQNNINAFNYIKEKMPYSQELEMIFIREYLYLVVQIYILNGYGNKQIRDFINECNSMYPDWKKNKYICFQNFTLRLCLTFIKLKWIFILKMVFFLKKVRR